MGSIADLLTPFEIKRLQARLGANDAKALLNVAIESPLGQQCRQLAGLLSNVIQMGIEREMQTLAEEILLNSLITWYFG